MLKWSKTADARGLHNETTARQVSVVDGKKCILDKATQVTIQLILAAGFAA